MKNWQFIFALILVTSTCFASFVVPNGAITTAKLASQAVTAAKIANNTITATQIANTTISATQIVNNTIGATQISTTTLTSGNYAPVVQASSGGTFTPLTAYYSRIGAQVIVSGSFTGVFSGAWAVQLNVPIAVSNFSSSIQASGNATINGGGQTASVTAVNSSGNIQVAGNATVGGAYQYIYQYQVP